MAEFAVPGPFGETDLRDEFGPDPVGAFFPYRRSGEGLSVADQVTHAGPQFGERPVVVPGADLAGVAQRVAAVVVPDEQRSEAASAAGRIGEAADHELLLGDALELQPVLRAE